MFLIVHKCFMENAHVWLCYTTLALHKQTKQQYCSQNQEKYSLKHCPEVTRAICRASWVILNNSGVQDILKVEQLGFLYHLMLKMQFCSHLGSLILQSRILIHSWVLNTYIFYHSLVITMSSKFIMWRLI